MDENEKESRKELEEKYDKLDNKLIIFQNKTLKLECAVKEKEQLMEQCNDYIEELERKREESDEYIEELERDKEENAEYVEKLKWQHDKSMEELECSSNVKNEYIARLEREDREKDNEMEKRAKKLEKEKIRLKKIIADKDQTEESLVETTEELCRELEETREKADECKNSYEELKEKYKRLKADMKKERSSKNFWERRGSPIARPRQSRSVLYESGILDDDEAPKKADRRKDELSAKRKVTLPAIEHGNLVERSTRCVQSPPASTPPLPAIQTQQQKKSSAYRPLPQQLVEETKIPVPNYREGLFDKPRYQPRPPQLPRSSRLPVPLYALRNAKYALPTPPKEKKVKRTRKYRGKIAECREKSGQGEGDDITPGSSVDEAKPSVWFVDS